MLWFVGLGISGFKSIPTEAIEILSKADIVYLEQFTSPFVTFLILAKSDFPIGLVNCSRYTISAFDRISIASLGIDLNPEIPKPTNQSITASFYREVFLNAVEIS